MIAPADHLRSSTARKLPLRVRPDLVVRQQTYQGQTSWAVKEPLGQAYFRFTLEDFSLLQMLDGNSSLDEIKERFERRFPHAVITTQHLWEFIGSLHRGNLLISSVADQGQPLKTRRDERQRKELLAKLTNVLSIRFRGFDPHGLFRWLYPKVRWLFSPLAVTLCCGLALAALALIVVQFDVFQRRLPAFHQFFGLKSAAGLLVALAVTKIIHEFGHGLTCKHFGGECHEIGVLVLVLAPCLYCNVSDSWMLPNKWHRAAIGAAGMYVEIVLASICTFVWWFSEPGLLNHLCLYVMFVSSVSTIVFNANPLLRYDGYYILSDVLEIPNLRQKATAAWQRALGGWCLGLEHPEDRYLPPRRRALFLGYGLASAAYSWFVLYMILWFLSKVLAPYRLQIFGQALAVVAIAGLVVMPLWKLGRFFEAPGRWEEVKKLRLAASLGVLAASLAVVVFVPLPHTVLCPVEVKAHGAAPVYVAVPGRLSLLQAKAARPVQAGDVLAQLDNVDLDLEIASLEQQRDEQAARHQMLGRLRFSDPQSLAQIPQAREALRSLEEQLAKRLEDRLALTLRAPRDGWILPPPERPVEPQGAPADGRLPAWSGTPLEPKNLGCFLAARTLFCQVGDPRQLEAVLVLDQADIELISEGCLVDIKLNELPGQEFHGVIDGISQMEMQYAPAQLAGKGGGELATRTDKAGHEHPQSTSYQARVLLEDEGDLLRLGLGGRAKVHTANRTLAQRLWRYLSHTFRFGT